MSACILQNTLSVLSAGLVKCQGKRSSQRSKGTDKTFRQCMMVELLPENLVRGGEKVLPIVLVNKELGYRDQYVEPRNWRSTLRKGYRT